MNFGLKQIPYVNIFFVLLGIWKTIVLISVHISTNPLNNTEEYKRVNIEVFSCSGNRGRTSLQLGCTQPNFGILMTVSDSFP